MALSKVNYVDNQTIITAQNLNDIQDEIIQNTKLIKNVAPRNLLDNSYWDNPNAVINERKNTYVTGKGTYPIDRWQYSYDGDTVRGGAGYDSTHKYLYLINNSSNEGNTMLYQNIPMENLSPGKYTFALRDAGTNLSTSMLAYINGGILKYTTASPNADGIMLMTFEITEVQTYLTIYIYAGPNKTLLFDWAALYEGEYTLDTLPEYQPKGYMVEALNCGALHVTTTATLNEGQWSNSAPFEQSIVIPGIIESDVPHITPVYSTTNTTAIAQKEAWACVSNAIAENGVIRFICFEDKPTTTIPIQIEVNR